MTSSVTAVWGSDLVTETLRTLGVEYVALTPGSSIRGLHDSLVHRHDAEAPEIVLCPHEELAISLAHGYAKVTGRAMAAAVHANVGLQHAAMALFCAFADRQPILVLGGNGPVDATRRRAWIDWLHTSDSPTALVRDITKAALQPAGLGAIPGAIATAWNAAHAAPAGPVFVSIDKADQESTLAGGELRCYPPRHGVADAATPNAEAVRRAAKLLWQARYPVILLGRGRVTPRSWSLHVDLAECLAAAVLPDLKSPASFPSSHYLVQAGMHALPDDQTLIEQLGKADVVLSLDRIDVAGLLGSYGRPDAKLIEIINGYDATWSAAHAPFPLPDAAVRIQTDVDASTEALLRELQSTAPVDEDGRAQVEDRRDILRAQHQDLEASWNGQNAGPVADRPTTWDIMVSLRQALGSRAAETILARLPIRFPNGSWRFERPLSYLGDDGGAGVGSGPGMTVGAALAARPLGRPVVGVLGDGDVLMAPQALWTAAHYRIPVMVVVANNHGYETDYIHQRDIGRSRGRRHPERGEGVKLVDPVIDYAALAKSLGCDGLGPVRHRHDLRETMRRAVGLLGEGRPILVDVHVAEP